MTYTSTQSLIITIIVLLILSGASISMLAGDNGILTRSSEAKVQTAISSKKEEVSFAINEELIANNGDIDKVTIENVLSKVKKNYSKASEKNKITAETTGEEENKFPGEITYSPPASGISEDIVITVDENLKVSGTTAEPDEFANISKVTPNESTYQRHGHIYYNTPDLSGFNPESTYYVTYDETGNNPKIAGRIDRVEEPEGWHDYENKIWANVVTVTGNEVTYWTWIPRYKYLTKTQDTSMASGITEVKFVKTNSEGVDECTLWDETEGDYSFTQSTSGKKLNDDYKLSDAFQFDGEARKGYWASKYEVQDMGLSGIEKIYAETNGKKINVSTSNPSGKYTIYVQGTEYAKGVSLPYTVKGLKSNKKYDICVYSETNQRMVGRTTGLTSEVVEVDLDGFNPESTYYVLYDRAGNNEHIGERIELDSNGKATNMPEGWYDYDNKIWANVVTVVGNNVTYWTYIPRFEYAAGPGNTSSNSLVKYIKSTQTKPDGGMTISDAFNFDGKARNGYWASKYEVQITGLNGLEQIYSEVDGSKVTVSTTNPSGTYTVYVNGKQTKTGQTLPYTIDVGKNSKYDIMLINETENRVVGSTTGLSNSIIEVDLSGFNPNCTYYVTYDENGENEQIGSKIQLDSNGKATNIPKNWYNYEKKRWANVVTINNDENGKTQTTYWTYIPKFQYLATENKQSIVQYMKPTDTVEFPFKLPQSFNFNNATTHKGYWVSKYEVQNAP